MELTTLIDNKKMWKKIKNYFSTKEKKRIINNSREMYNANILYFNSLKEIINKKNAYIVIDGDYSGQVYCTIPLKLFKKKITEADIFKIATEIDAENWNDDSGLEISYIISKDNFIEGGMGGGVLDENLIWIHSDLDKKNILKKFKSFINNN